MEHGNAGPTGGARALPRVAVVWAVLDEELARTAAPLTVVDVGGGTGGFAVPLAQAGHLVTVVDANPDALAALTRRAAEADMARRVTAVQGDADSLTDLVPSGGADLVLCHSLLEVVEDPVRVVEGLVAALRPGGAASVVVACRAGAVLTRAVSGQLDAASALLTDPNGTAGPGDRLLRRFDAGGITELLSAAGLDVERVHGVRVAADLLPGVVAESEQEALLAFELAAAALPPYRDVATQLHVLARKPSG